MVNRARIKDPSTAAMSDQTLHQDSRRPTIFGDSRPRYVQLAETLARDVAAARFPVGSLLPTEHQLCEQHGVSRATVREALRRLAELGLIAREHGVGTRVLALDTRANYMLSARSADEVMGYAVETRLIVKRQRIVMANSALARLLGCETGTTWAHLSGLRMTVGAAALPLSSIELYVAGEYSDLTERPEIERTPIYRLIERERGVRVAEIRQDVTAGLLTPGDARTLKAVAGSAALHVVRRFLDDAGQPIEVTRNVHPADRFTFALRLKLG